MFDKSPETAFCFCPILAAILEISHSTKQSALNSYFVVAGFPLAVNLGRKI